MATYVYDEPKSVRYDGGVVEERQEEKGEEVVSANERADSLGDQGSGSQETTPVLMVDPTQTVTVIRQRDGERGQSGDADNIYESLDDVRSSDVTGPQEDMRENTAGTHTQGPRSETVIRTFKVVAVCLGMLCLMLLAVIIGQAVHNNSANNQFQNNYNNLIEERNQLQSEVNQLKKDVADKPCPSKWKIFGNRSYYRSTEKKTWDKSREACQKTGGDLLIINSKEEEAFIRGLTCGLASSWIGLKRTNGQWALVDETALTTQNWAKGWPNKHGANNCAEYRHNDGEWKNVSCEKNNTWICEK